MKTKLTNESQKKAYRNYIKRKRALGWKRINVIVPSELYTELMDLKHRKFAELKPAIF